MSCETCGQGSSVIHCLQCSLDTCFACAYRRHRFGTLTQHKFDLLPFSRSHPASKSCISDGERCQVCEDELAFVRCPICDMVFCGPCSDSFHAQGQGAARTALLNHKIKFEHGSSPPPSPISTPPSTPATHPSTPSLRSPNRRSGMSAKERLRAKPRTLPRTSINTSASKRGRHQRNLSDSASSFPSSNGSAIQPLRLSLDVPGAEGARVGGGSSSASSSKDSKVAVGWRTPMSRSPRGSETTFTFNKPTQTFKLANYALDNPPNNPADSVDNPIFNLRREAKYHFKIVVDHEHRILTVTSTSKERHIHHTRHFSSIKSIVSHPDDPCLFYFDFKDSTARAYCCSLYDSEGEMIRDLLIEIVESPNAGVFQPDDLYLAWSVTKKGKMKMKSSTRYLTISTQHFKLYRDKYLQELSHTIPLSSMRVTCDRIKSKTFSVYGPERSFVLKTNSGTERSTVVAVLSQAMANVNHAPPMRSHPLSLSRGKGAPLNRTSPTSLSSNSLASPSSSSNLSLTVPTSSRAGKPPLPKTPVKLQRTHTSKESIMQSFVDLEINDQQNSLTADPGILLDSKQALSLTSSSVASFDTDPAPELDGTISFTEIKHPGALFERPSEILKHGVYHLMTLLADSMTIGAQIGPSLYVPKEVWFQDGVKFHAFTEKLHYFEGLKEGLASMAQVQQVQDLEQGLYKFRICIEYVQNKLAKHLSFIHTVKTPITNKKKKKLGLFKKSMKQLEKALNRAATSVSTEKVNSTEYVHLLLDILQQGLMFDHWIREIQHSCDDVSQHADSKRQSTTLSSFRSSLSNATSARSPVTSSSFTSINQADLAQLDRQTVSDIMDHLEHISEFFYQVVCCIVILELKTVLKRYIKHCSRNVCL